MEIVSLLIGILTQWYIWIPLVLVLSYLTWQNYQRVDEFTPTESVLLVLEIPRTNDKQELAAEQLFASLHGILRDKRELRLNAGVQEHLSFEIASINGQIQFYVWVPKTLQSFVEGQIYAQYPTVQIHLADADYTEHERNHTVVYTTELALTDAEFLPIRTFQNFEVDPLAGITGTLAKLEATGEELWVQVLLRPLPDTWHMATERYVSGIRNGQSVVPNLGGSLQIVEALWRPPDQPQTSDAKPELSERDKTRIAEAEKKATKLGYEVKIRLAYLGGSQTNAKLHMQALVGTFKQFNSTNLNGFRAIKSVYGKEFLEKYSRRAFYGDGFVLNIEELASVFHLPHTNVETPNIVWASAKTAEPPAKLPVLTGDDAIDDQMSAFGVTDFRGINHQFGMLRSDRSRHVYIIGQTGAGKSGLLELFALSDIFHNQGYAIIDPHGDFAINNMKFIPAGRLKDVVYFNPADTAYPLGFNPLEVTNPAQKTNISSEVIGVLKRMFGDSWGPRLEYILRYTILALLDRPETTMLDITRMLTDKKFRKETLKYCKDTVVLQFWTVEFASWNDKFVAEAVAPVLNKVGAFTANPIIRNIIGQPRSTFNIRQIMDEGKILIVNLSKGLIGEDNAAILGSFLVTKIQLAAMSRSDIPDIRDRRPFYLYVDEFQNFATDSFATILSEARKYGLNLTVANQYISQMGETVRDAVFGNVGTMISFRVSPDDAPILSKQFEPNFEAIDLLQMHNRNFVINMVINGEKTPSFSARTLELPPPQADNTLQIIEQSRRDYAGDKTEVEAAISRLVQPLSSTPNQPTAARRATTPTQPATVTDQSNNQPTAATNPTTTEATKPKRRRSRSRRRKNTAAASDSTPNAAQQTAVPVAAHSNHTNSQPTDSTRQPGAANNLTNYTAAEAEIAIPRGRHTGQSSQRQRSANSSRQAAAVANTRPAQQSAEPEEVVLHIHRQKKPPKQPAKTKKS